MDKEFISTYDFLTVAEIPAFSRSCSYTLALGVFLDNFYECDFADKVLALQDEPMLGILSKIEYCKLAATAHKLANDYNIPIPNWTYKEEYTMPHPVYAFDSEDTEFHEILRVISPVEYKIRNLFLGSGVLKRV